MVYSNRNPSDVDCISNTLVEIVIYLYCMGAESAKTKR